MIVAVRPTRLDDLDFVLAAEQHADNRPYIFNWTPQQHESALTDPTIAHLLIERTSDRTPVGYALVGDLNSPHQSIQLWRFVVTNKGQGYGKQALKLIQKLAFETWNAHRLWLDVKDYNTRARHVYESVGFKQEGVLRECLKVGDRFETLIVMSMLRHEYQPRDL
jgi:diamine N-acetyltransferase